MPDNDRSQRATHNDVEMDSLLRRSMAAPIPRLSPEFHQRLSGELRRRSQPPGKFGPLLLVAYAVLSAVISASVMRSQGLGWPVIATLSLAPLAMIELARRLPGHKWKPAE
jgi:hypothetical protein